MAWTRPEYSRSEVDRAGHIIAQDSNLLLSQLDEAYTILNNWRSSHSYPLHSLKMTLLNRAKSIEPSAIVAQRIKRTPAIRLKLQHNAAMKLSQMQDIGGCRAIMPGVDHVQSLAQVYAEATAKNPRRGGQFVKKYDYIANPKPSGYRGVHLIYKYCTEAPEFKPYEGLRIELQIRSFTQHWWATAVETVDTFTGQALKSNIGTVPWQRFFTLIATAFAVMENCPLVPNTPHTTTDIRSAINEWQPQIALLRGINQATEQIASGKGDIFLLELNPNAGVTNVTSFQRHQLLVAQTAYLELEKAIAAEKGVQAVLVSADSFADLRKAYPNYFLDITAFVSLMESILEL
jgi:ppGpp synthetase/RelA/SpoT-type nucleotidyltranferase